MVEKKRFAGQFQTVPGIISSTQQIVKHIGGRIKIVDDVFAEAVRAAVAKRVDGEAVIIPVTKNNGLRLTALTVNRTRVRSRRAGEDKERFMTSLLPRVVNYEWNKEMLE